MKIGDESEEMKRSGSATARTANKVNASVQKHKMEIARPDIDMVHENAFIGKA